MSRLTQRHRHACRPSCSGGGLMMTQRTPVTSGRLGPCASSGMSVAHSDQTSLGRVTALKALDRLVDVVEADYLDLRGHLACGHQLEDLCGVLVGTAEGARRFTCLSMMAVVEMSARSTPMPTWTTVPLTPTVSIASSVVVPKPA